MKIYKLLLVGLFFATTLLANANLYVFVFKDGVALKDTKIQVGELTTTTNQYGYAEFLNLQSDTYEVSYFKDDKIFALSEVNIVPEQDSQIFLTLERKGHQLDLDLPLEAYSQDFKKLKVKKLEGPKGTLELKLVDSKSKEVVKKAKLFFRGYQLEAMSDEKGIVKIDIPRGKYDISVVHPNYVMKVLKEIEVKEKKTTSQEVKLTKSDISLEEYVVLAPAVEGSLASTFAELKDSDVSGEALSSEQFSKSGDSSAAGALKRVTGITIVGGKYVYVRGLGERYSTVLLNDLQIPSPEPTKRVVPLDIFPTGVIESMNIQKTYTADLPGNFGGGTINIKTKNIPKEDNYVKLNVSVGTNDATGKDGLYNKDVAKPIPSSVIQANANFSAIGSHSDNGLTKDMLTYRTYGLSTKTIEPDTSVSISAGQSFKTARGIRYGFAGSAYYKSSTDNKEMEKFSWERDTKVYGGSYDSTKYTTKYGSLLSFILDDQEKNKVKYTNLFVHQEDNTFSYGDYFTRNANLVHRYYSSYVEKELMMHQFEGEHNLYKNFDFNWNYEFGSATNQTPGEVTYWYYDNEDGNFNLKTENPFRYLQTDLVDNLTNYKFDLKYSFDEDNKNNNIKIGYNSYSKDRDFKARRYRIDYNSRSSLLWTSSTPELEKDVDTILSNYNSSNFVLYDNYISSDFYLGYHDISAPYIMADYEVNDKLSFLAGVRKEDSIQKLETYVKVGAFDVKKVSYDLISNDTLPSIATKYKLSEDIFLKGSYAKSVSRPDFREFVPSEYIDPITGDKYIGYGKEYNSDGSIKSEGLTYTQIDNYDLTFEYFLSFNEMLALSLFKKDFTNPIETVVITLDKPVYTYRNANSATSEGIELSVRKNLSFINENLSNYVLACNYSIINSTVYLDKNSTDSVIQNLTNKSRPMQGQSPYVMNIQLGYDNIHTRRSAMLLYNEYGKRIVALGTEGYDDEYEQPFKKLDFVVKWGLNDTYDLSEKKIGYTLSFKAQNLLDSEVKVTQGGEVSKSYKPGKSFNLSLSIKY